MSIAPPVYVSPKTRQWAISAVVLGVLYFLLNIPSLLNYPKSLAMFGSSKAIMALVISSLESLISVGFVIAGVNAQKGRANGREALSYVAAAAIVLTLLGGAWGLITIHDPSYSNALNTAMGHGGGGLPANFVSILVTIVSVTVIVMSVIQLVYCALLYRMMSAEPEQAPVLDGYYNSPGAWPPPPQQ